MCQSTSLRVCRRISWFLCTAIQLCSFVGVTGSDSNERGGLTVLRAPPRAKALLTDVPHSSACTSRGSRDAKKTSEPIGPLPKASMLWMVRGLHTQSANGTALYLVRTDRAGAACSRKRCQLRPVLLVRATFHLQRLATCIADPLRDAAPSILLARLLKLVSVLIVITPLAIMTSALPLQLTLRNMTVATGPLILSKSFLGKRPYFERDEHWPRVHNRKPARALFGTCTHFSRYTVTGYPPCRYFVPTDERLSCPCFACPLAQSHPHTNR